MVSNPQTILFAASEVNGLVKSGGLADVAKALPLAFQQLAAKVFITLPYYAAIKQAELSNGQQSELVLETELTFWPHTPYQVRLLDLEGIKVFAIEQDKYFDRRELYAENNQAYSDNGERFSFFSAACLDMLPKLDILPDVIHANDWHTGFIPFLLKKRYANDAFYQSIKTVFTIHNAVFKGDYSFEELTCLAEMHSGAVHEIKSGDSYVSMLKAGILFSDKVTTVSPSYAQELTTELGSHGLADLFRQREKDLSGILNGCDYDEWDPSKDPYLAQTYNSKVRSLDLGKKANKKALQQMVGLPQENVAMYGMVCRLTHQKGIQYLLPILDTFLQHQVQLVIVATGDPALAEPLRAIANAHAEKFVFVEAYNEQISHLVEAGSDFFIMPSEFEPCGLNQIYSMAYGTLPIVRSVGGLKDTVIDHGDDTENATGFVFKDPTAHALLITLQRSLLVYCQSSKEIKRLQQNGMKQNFSWHESAKKYLALYQSIGH